MLVSTFGSTFGRAAFGHGERQYTNHLDTIIEAEPNCSTQELKSEAEHEFPVPGKGCWRHSGLSGKGKV